MPRGGGLPRWRWATAGRAPPPCRALRRRGYAPLGVGVCTSGGSAPPPLCGPTPLEAWVYRRPLGGRGLHLRGGAPPSPLWVYTFGGVGLPGVPLGGRRRRLQGWPLPGCRALRRGRRCTIAPYRRLRPSIAQCGALLRSGVPQYYAVWRSIAQCDAPAFVAKCHPPFPG